jgi:FAS-associated factor 2
LTGNHAGNQSINDSRARNRNDSNLARELAARFPNWPPFIDGSYTQAVREAKRQSKLLLIYVHDATEQCDRFCRETLATEDMSNFMRENFVGWMGPVTGADGARLKATLRVSQFPFIALLAPTAGQLAILYRHTGHIAIDDLIHTLLVKLEDHAGIIHAMQAQSQADATLQDARSIRQTQDTEYEEALARDRELAQQRAQAEEQAREEARLAAEAAEKEPSWLLSVLNLNHHHRLPLFLFD